MSSLSASVSPELLALIAAQRQALDSASSLESFIAAFHGTIALSVRLQAAREDDPALDLEAAVPLLPGLAVRHLAEGTEVVLVPEADVWMALARQHEIPEAIAFLEWVARCFDNPAGVGWPLWNQMTWDYGGFSRLGTGCYAQILQGADALLGAGSPFSARIQRIRTRALGDLIEEEGTFPYGDPSGEPTPLHALRTEVETILGTVRLSLRERMALLKRIEDGFAYRAILP